MAFDRGSLDQYITVPERISEFYSRYPEGSLQPQNPYTPYQVVDMNGRQFIVYTALAYRTPDDPRPGVGVAWEPYPGTTPYTRDSELMNAETSAWGRAIVATGVSASRGIASREEVRNRQTGADGFPLRQQGEQAPPADRGGQPEVTPPEPDRKSQQAQELAILAYELVRDGATVDDLKTKVYEPAHSARCLRTMVMSPFSEERGQLSAVITEAKRRVTEKGWPEGSVGAAAQT